MPKIKKRNFSVDQRVQVRSTIYATQSPKSPELQELVQSQPHTLLFEALTYSEVTELDTCNS